MENIGFMDIGKYIKNHLCKVNLTGKDPGIGNTR